jgi:hypothetical protein
MKTTIKKSVALATMILAMYTSYSQLKISGEIRPRFEYRHGYKALADSAMLNASFIDQRTRLNFDYTQNRLQVKVVLQDVRTWGSQKQLVGNEDFGVSIHEAWGQAFITDNFKLKFGRQELVYDDHRILGSVGWAQQARSHDALVFKYEKNNLKFHFGAAYNQDKPQMKTTSYTVPKSYKTMQYIWSNYKFNETVKMSFLAMGVGQQVDYINTAGNNAYQTNYTLTTGTRLVYKKNKLGVTANAYYQLGATNTFPAKNVKAYNFAIEGSYKISDKIFAALGGEILSGNSQVDTSASYLNTEHAFNPYFGTNHKFNGFMDYFYVGNHVGSVGLNDFYFKLVYKHSKFTTGFTTHAFFANTSVLDNDQLNNSGKITAMDPYLGTEIDLFAAFKLAPGTTCKLGYSQMLATNTMEAIKGGDRNEINNWGYVMIIMKPTFFDSSKLNVNK